MQKPVVTVTLNPCIDKTMVFDSVALGRLNRAYSVRTDMSGKGINVAKALTAIGCKAICTGFCFSEGGDQLLRTLDAENIAHDFIGISGRLRTNVKVYDDTAAQMTELNEKGPSVPPGSAADLIGILKKYAGRAAMYVLSGSIPDGVPPDIYKTIIESLPDSRCVLDADSDAFKTGLTAAPFAVKPNLYELELAYGVQLPTHRDINGLCKHIIESVGIKIILVSMGGDGAIICDGKKSFYSPALDIPVKGLQGAGDSMVAGMCASLSKNAPLDEILKYAMASAAGSIVREGTLLCTAEGFSRMYDMVHIFTLD